MVHWLPIDLVAYGSASLSVLRPRSAESAGECVHPRHRKREIYAIKTILTASTDCHYVGSGNRLGKECSQCKGMGYVTAPQESSAASQT